MRWLVLGQRAVGAAEHDRQAGVGVVGGDVLDSGVVGDVDQIRLPLVDCLARHRPPLSLRFGRGVALDVHLEDLVFRLHVLPEPLLETRELTVGPAPGRVETHDVKDLQRLFSLLREGGAGRHGDGGQRQREAAGESVCDRQHLFLHGASMR